MIAVQESGCLSPSSKYHKIGWPTLQTDSSLDNIRIKVMNQ